MGNAHPPSWALLRIIEMFQCLSQKFSSPESAIFYFLPLAMVPDAWLMFGCIISTRYLCRNLCI